MSRPAPYSVVLKMRARWTSRMLDPRWRSGSHHLVNLVANLADMVRMVQQLPRDSPLWLDVDVVAPVTAQRRQAVLSVRVNFLR